jgi:hypothetical protein
LKQLTAAHKAAIRYLVAKDLGDTDMTVEEFCTTMGIKSKKTIYNWQADPVFAAELKRQREELEDSPDLFAVRCRENVLFGEQANLMRLQKKFDANNDTVGMANVSKEIRQYHDAILKHTEHVKATGAPVTARDLSDEDLLAACLKEEVAPEGMTIDELEARLKKGEK